MRRALGWGLILGIGTLLGVAVGGVPERGTDPPLQVVAVTTTDVPHEPAVATATTGPVRPPSEVKVLAVNASGATGRAAAVSRDLTAGGYAVIEPGVNAVKEPSTAVYWSAGHEAEARVLAATLGLPGDTARPLPDPPPVADLGGAAVVVLIGQDRAG